METSIGILVERDAESNLDFPALDPDLLDNQAD